MKVLAILSWTIAATAFAAAERPNIVFILADDLGRADLGCYGQKLIRTPRIDRLAAEGMRFTQHYSGSASCAPARSTLMTGQHTGHTRIRLNSDKALLPEDTTLPQMLQRAGYATGGYGKWGLGLENSTGAPWKKGFDEFIGFLDQTHAHSHYPDYVWHNDRRIEIPENRDKRRGKFAQDIFVTHALEFVRRNRAKPFFLYLPLTVPHAELMVPEDSLAEYRGKWPEPKAFAGSKTYSPQTQPRAVRAAMITRLDRDVGRLLDLLDELRLAGRTLVIFSSDNGPATAGGHDPQFFQSAGSLRGLKFTLYEGGIRTPLIARWPGRVPQGATSDVISAFWDWLPTFAEIASVKPPPNIDGLSLAPTLLGTPAKQRTHDYLYWEHAPAQALRIGDWKAVRTATGDPIQLFDLAKDEGETRDVAAEHGDLVRDIEQRMAAARTESPDFPLTRPRNAKKK